MCRRSIACRIKVEDCRDEAQENKVATYWLVGGDIIEQWGLSDIAGLTKQLSASNADKTQAHINEMRIVNREANRQNKSKIQLQSRSAYERGDA